MAINESRGAMGYKINLIVACCENNGIGFHGKLPWALKEEVKYFSRLTKRTSDASKRNAVVMGRHTWESIPSKFRPLPRRLNILISTKAAASPDAFPGCIAVSNFPDALAAATEREEEIETVWIIGGAAVYEAALTSDRVHRIYLTTIFTAFQCDTFLPALSLEKDYIQVTDDDVSEEMQEEAGVKYKYEIYQKIRPN